MAHSITKSFERCMARASYVDRKTRKTQKRQIGDGYPRFPIVPWTLPKAWWATRTATRLGNLKYLKTSINLKM